MITLILILLVAGLVMGSFVNAAVWRLHEQQERLEHPRKAKTSKLTDQELSLLRGRSMCTHCHHLLTTADLIPVVSYLWLRGRCRYCHKPIEDTPLPELGLASLFVVSYIWWPYSLGADGLTLGRVLFIGWLLCLVGFMILAIYDLKWFLLPDRVVLPLIGLTPLLVLVQASVFHGGLATLVTAAWGVLPTAGLFYVLYLVSRGRWIGFGDVKLAVALGLLVGGPLPALILLFVASFAGSLSAIPLLLGGKAVARTRIPFGPFLLLATAIVVLFGSAISQWYLGIFTV